MGQLLAPLLGPPLGPVLGLSLHISLALTQLCVPSMTLKLVPTLAPKMVPKNRKNKKITNRSGPTTPALELHWLRIFDDRLHTKMTHPEGPASNEQPSPKCKMHCDCKSHLLTQYARLQKSDTVVKAKQALETRRYLLLLSTTSTSAATPLRKSLMEPILTPLLGVLNALELGT